MSFEEEIQKLPSDVEGFFQGDISIGKTKIPKIAIAGVVIGLVVILALRSRVKVAGGGSSSSVGASSGNSGDLGFSNPLSGLQPLSNNSSLNSNPLGAIPSSNIPTPNLTLPDLSIPPLSGLPMSSFPDFSSIPVIGSGVGAYFGNTGINGGNGSDPSNTVNLVADGHFGGVSNRNPDVNAIPGRNVKNAANVGFTSSQVKQTLDSSLAPVSRTAQIIGGFIKGLQQSNSAGSALGNGAGSVNGASSAVSKLVQKASTVVPSTKIGFGAGQTASIPVISIPRYNPTPVPVNYAASSVVGGSTSRVVGLPPPTNVPFTSAVGSVSGFGGSAAIPIITHIQNGGV